MTQNYFESLLNFRDPRIAGLQFLMDSITFPNTFDFTEFFRLDKPFSAGYAIVSQLLEPHYNNLRKTYLELLKSEQFLNDINELAERGSSRAKLLLEGKLMCCPENAPKFDGKRVIVTGSETGIGREIALEFARRNARVALHYPVQEHETGALSAVQLIQESGRQATAYKGDFKELDNALRFVDSALTYLGGIDILINNAGITMSRAFEDTTPQQFDTLMNVNFRSPFFITQKIAKHMKEQGGVIINMSSPHARAGKAGHSVYSGTKGALSSLTRELSMELIPYNIRLNAVSPGGVFTPNQFKLMPNFHELGRQRPVGRWNNASDIAYFITFLCSEQAKTTIGQVFEVDGGMSAGLSPGKTATQLPDIIWGKGYVEGV